MPNKIIARFITVAKTGLLKENSEIFIFLHNNLNFKKEVADSIFT